MSLSTDGFKDARNPCKYWLQFHNEKWEWYNKEKKEAVVLKELPPFAVLDKKLMKITGYSEPLNAGISSNEVRSVDDELVVLLYHKGGRKEEKLRGPYKEIKEQLPNGSKFTISMYVAMPESAVSPESESDKLVICNLRIAGGALQGWLDSVKKMSSESELAVRWVEITGYTDHKRGKVEYKAPIFVLSDKKSPADHQATIHLDEDLQAYLKDYLTGKVRSVDEDLQALAGEEDQTVPEDGPPPAENLEELSENDNSFLDVKLASGKLMRDLSLAELRETKKAAEDAGIDSAHKAMVALNKTIAYRTAENDRKIAAEVAAAKSTKAANPFGLGGEEQSSGDEFFDEDDIPF